MSCFYQDPTTPEWYLIMYHRTLSSDVRGSNIGMSGALMLGQSKGESVISFLSYSQQIQDLETDN
jgi:hypothetical protein